MRVKNWLAMAFAAVFLSSCIAAPVLIGNQLQSKLLWSLLKPLVGFDPNSVKLFDNPMIKDRMVKILGDKYDPAMKLLKTAQEIQQDGPLFYVVSRYAPPQVQEITDKAGLVWNSKTNQMAVMLIKDGVPEVFSEQAENAREKLTPTFPKELQDAYDTAKHKQDELKAAADVLKAPEKVLENTATDTIKDTLPLK